MTGPFFISGRGNVYMATLSDRQKILAYLVRVGAKFENKKDLLTYLATQLSDRRSDLRNERDYLQTLVAAGYQSATAQKFYDDYKSPSKTVTAAAKEKSTDETTVEPDPPQDLMEHPETITTDDVSESEN